jgi:hypothetical protein
MPFIDIFNFKKYFITPSDSQVARYGHVNGLYDELGPRIKNPGSYTSSDNAGVIVPVTTYSGSINLPNQGVPLGTGNDNPGVAEVQLTSDLIKSNSIVMLTPIFQAIDLMVMSPVVSEGAVNVIIYNYSPNEIEGIRFNYLIIS